MTISYSEFQESIVFTARECKMWLAPEFFAMGILGLTLVIFLMIAGIKFVNYNKFITENKLQEKYQEWKKLNKGL